jgi:hypothetical protein
VAFNQLRAFPRLTSMTLSELSWKYTGMSDHSVLRAGDLGSDERLIIERWLGRTLSSDETISISAYRPHTPPDSAKQETLRRSIIGQAREIGARSGAISDQEVDELLNDAYNDIRTRPR